MVGPNGVGKSTLLQLLAGWEEPDAGTVRLDPPTATVGYLAQEHERRGGETVGAALARRTGVAAAEAELGRAGEALGRGDDGADDRFAVALERYEGLSAGDIDARIAGTLRDLGLPSGIVDQDATTLSGGQAAKVALAAIVLARFDITLLDEPTNDLDFDGLERLESVVAERAGAMVVVSHDRAFLDATVTSVLEIDEHDHSARLFGGGWSAYLEERATARRHAEDAFALNQAQRRELADRARRERQWATSAVRREKRDPRDHDKAQRDFRINRTEKLASRARQTERAIERLGPVDKPWDGWDLRFTIEQAPRAGAVVARFDSAVIARGDFRLGPISMEIGWAERIGLVGPNGAGKTSFVDALLGRLPLESGTAWLGPSVVVGELGQDRRLSADAAEADERVRPRPGHRTVRVDGARGPVVTGQVRAGSRAPRVDRGRSCPRGSGPGPSWPCSRPVRSTSSSSTNPPTISMFPPSSRSRRPCPASAGRFCWCRTTGACSRPSTSPVV